MLNKSLKKDFIVSDLFFIHLRPRKGDILTDNQHNEQ